MEAWGRCGRGGLNIQAAGDNLGFAATQHLLLLAKAAIPPTGRFQHERTQLDCHWQPDPGRTPQIYEEFGCSARRMCAAYYQFCTNFTGSKNASSAPSLPHGATLQVTTRVDIAKAQGVTRLWLPVPSINSEWQQSLESSYSSNGSARMEDDNATGARMLFVDFAADQAKPYVELTSRIRTRSRAQDWSQKTAVAEDAATLKYWHPA